MRFHFLLCVLFVTSCICYAETDSIGFNKQELLVGEIKSMDRGVLVIETNYSDSDFKIEWDKVEWLRTETRFMITLQDGTKYYSSIKSLNDSIATVFSDNHQQISFSIKKIVFLKSYDDKFLDRLSASIDIGFDLAKSRNLRSWATRSTVGYGADKWGIDAIINSNWSDQDDADEIQRTEGEINFRYVLPRRFYLITTQSFLSNTEQSLDYRSNSQVGLGNFLYRTNYAYWGAKIGINRNNEKYTYTLQDENKSDSSTSDQTWEGYLGTELNLFDIGDLSFNLSITVYPGITDLGRIRTDSNLNLKYDLPHDFYIRLGGSMNTDNRADSNNKVDYVAQAGFGWEW